MSRWRPLAIVITLIVAFVAQCTNVLAVDEIPKIQLQVSPPKVEIEPQPGAMSDGVFQLTNTGSEAIDVRIYAENYANDQNSEDDQSPGRATWVKFNQTNYSINSNETCDVAYSVNVPKNISGGQHHIALFAEIVNNKVDSAATSINVISRIGVLLTVKFLGTFKSTDKSNRDAAQAIPIWPIILLVILIGMAIWSTKLFRKKLDKGKKVKVK